MFALDFLGLEMVVEIGVLSLKDAHHLVDFDFESVELAGVHVGEVVVHEMFKYEIHVIGFMGDFEDILT